MIRDTGSSHLLIDALTKPASLVLLILLQNSQNRGDRGKDARQDEMEHALAGLLRHLADSGAEAETRQQLLARADRLVSNAAATKTMSSADMQ